jgi:hypothetical protein
MGTYYSTAEERAVEWADVDHPYFYFDPDFRQFCLDKLAGLAALTAGWDCEGAPAIDRGILAAAKRMVEALPSHIAVRPMIVPLASGGLQFEWHNGRQTLELEFESPDQVHFLMWDPANGVEDEDVVASSDMPRLTDMIRWFMQGLFDDD